MIVFAVFSGYYKTLKSLHRTERSAKEASDNLTDEDVCVEELYVED